MYFIGKDQSISSKSKSTSTTSQFSSCIKFAQLEEDNQIKDFKDKKNRTAVPIIKIIDQMAPGTINYEFVKTGAGVSDEVSRDSDDLRIEIISRNAKYFLEPGIK